MPKIAEKEKEVKNEKSSIGYLSSDGFLWTDANPDLKLIEPRIFVSVNYNYLEFSRKPDRPPERRILSLINHGDYPIAFKVQTTDNYSYFVDRVCGVIPPRQTVVNAAIRMPNISTIQVFHRPHNEYQAGDQAEFYNRPHKDKMFILLAPQICQTFSPQAIFHNERCYEKLRIMLRYSGIEQKPGDIRSRQLLLHGVPGWATWKEESGERKKKNAKQIAEFRKIEMTIIQNASKEITEDAPKIPVCRLNASSLPNRSRTPSAKNIRRGVANRKKVAAKSIDRTPLSMKKTQSETPKKPSTETMKPITPSLETPKKSAETPNKPSSAESGTPKAELPAVLNLGGRGTKVGSSEVPSANMVRKKRTSGEPPKKTSTPVTPVTPVTVSVPATPKVGSVEKKTKGSHSPHEN